MATAPISDDETRNDYTATSGQTTFPYTFWIKDEDHLDVYVNGTLKTITTDYTVSATQSVSGGNVVFTSGLTSGDAVAIVYKPDIERLTEFTTSGNFAASSINLELSYLVSLVQFVSTQLNRKLGAADSDISISSFTLPSLSEGKALKWGASGLTNSTVDVDDLDTALADAQSYAAAAEDDAAQTAADVIQTGADKAAAAASASAAAASAASLPQNKFDATAAPTTGDDSDDGYSVGSRWVDVTNDESYICVDASIGAAVWINSTLTTDELGSAALSDTTDFAAAFTGYVFSQRIRYTVGTTAFVKANYSVADDDLIIVKGTAAGGGGGGAPTGTNNSTGGFGAAGATFIKEYAGSDLSASEDFVIGAKGTGGAANTAGTDGGDTTFKACTAAGGKGGAATNGAAGARGGTATGGDDNIAGGDGSSPSSAANIELPNGVGGASIYGSGAAGDSAGAGAGAQAYGSGGGGGTRTSGGTANVGGDGADGYGVIEVWKKIG